MNNINSQVKAAKKLAINKETIGHLTTTEGANLQRGFTVNCTYTC